jgi:hypothetical protein
MLKFLVFCHLTFAVGELVPSAVEDAHKALVTEPAVLPPELMKRDVATCAYVSGNPGEDPPPSNEASLEFSTVHEAKFLCY